MRQSSLLGIMFFCVALAMLLNCSSHPGVTDPQQDKSGMPNDKGTGKLIPAQFAVVVGDSSLVAAAPVACHLVLEVQSISAYRVRRFIDADIEAGWITAPWDGRNDAGDVCSNGLYLAHARFNTWDLYTVFELKGRR